MCRSRRELSNEYLLAKIGVDTAENELFQVLFNIIQHYSIIFSFFNHPLFLNLLFNIIQYYSILFIRVLNGEARVVRQGKCQRVAAAPPVTVAMSSCASSWRRSSADLLLGSDPQPPPADVSLRETHSSPRASPGERSSESAFRTSPALRAG